jgi:hypothetical protein
MYIYYLSKETMQVASLIMRSFALVSVVGRTTGMVTLVTIW